MAIVYAIGRPELSLTFTVKSFWGASSSGRDILGCRREDSSTTAKGFTPYILNGIPSEEME